MTKPRVTVGMPVYNRAHVVGSAIAGVLAQTHEDFEFLIADDGSSDSSPEVVKSFADPRIEFLGSKRRGPPHPLNELYSRARGEFIIILHDHDIFDPALLEKSVTALDRHPTAGFVLQGSATVAEDGVSNYRTWPLDWPEFNPGRAAGAKFLRTAQAFGSPFHACSMVRTSALDAVGRSFDVRYGLYADLDLWLRLLQKYDFCYLNDVLFKFREREKVGHFLDGRAAEVFQSLRHIFLKHSVEFFADDPQGLGEALENIRTSYKDSEFRLAARDFLYRRPNWRASMRRVAGNPAQSIFKRKLAAALAGKGE